MPNSCLLLDTCAAIWIASEQPIAEEAEAVIAQALDADEPVYVSPISAWEIGLLAARGRIALEMTPSRWFERLMEAPGLHLAEMRTNVLIASSSLPGIPPRDPADRIIVTTAREYRFRIVTRDRLLLAYAAQGHCRALAC